MLQSLTQHPATSDGLVGKTGRDYLKAGLAFLLGLLTILGALGFEHLGGYMPCELCLGQRVPYYLGLPLILLLLLAWSRLPASGRALGALLLGLVFVWSTYLGAFHAGVEWRFWPGPTACTGTGLNQMSFDDLNNINATRVVPCDQPQWHFLGISFAGYNALISALIAALLLWAGFGQMSRSARKA